MPEENAFYSLLVHPAFSGIPCLLIGFALGHWSHLWLDRRTEFNELADKLFPFVHHQGNAPSEWNDGLSGDFLLMTRRMGWWCESRFKRAIEVYEKATGPENRTPIGPTGPPKYTAQNSLQKRAANLRNALSDVSRKAGPNESLK